MSKREASPGVSNAALVAWHALLALSFGLRKAVWVHSCTCFRNVGSNGRDGPEGIVKSQQLAATQVNARHGSNHRTLRVFHTFNASFMLLAVARRALLVAY